MDKPSPLEISTHDHNSLDCSTVEMKETVKNKSYQTTISALQNESVNTPEYPNNDPETGQSTSPLYDCVRKKQVTNEDNQEDESAPPSYDPLYAAVQNQPGNADLQDEPERHSHGYEDLYTAVQKKTKQAPVSDEQEEDEIECYPEHVYSAVKKKKKPTTPPDELDPELEASVTSALDFKDMYTFI